MKGKLEKLYKKLYEEYGRPVGQWRLWCKKNKSKKDKEKIALGAILTQRTNWRNVEKAFDNLEKTESLSIKQIYKIGKKDMEKLEKLVRPSGFYKQKASRLFKFSEFIIENYGSLGNFLKRDLDFCREKLLEISGIGPETADSIMLYAGQKPVFVIDEYTRRFVKKHKLSKNLSYYYLQKLFESNLKRDFRFYQDFHALIVIDAKNK